jgi:hypothetical protein
MIEILLLEKVSNSVDITLMFIVSILLLFMEEEVDLKEDQRMLREYV